MPIRIKTTKHNHSPVMKQRNADLPQRVEEKSNCESKPLDASRVAKTGNCSKLDDIEFFESDDSFEELIKFEKALQWQPSKQAAQSLSTVPVINQEPASNTLLKQTSSDDEAFGSDESFEELLKNDERFQPQTTSQAISQADSGDVDDFAFDDSFEQVIFSLDNKEILGEKVNECANETATSAILALLNDNDDSFERLADQV